AYKGATWVALDRPLKSVAALDIYSFSSGYFVYEYPMVRWLESQGYDVKYVSNLDLDANAHVLDGARAFLSVGHDEYWSSAMRDHVEAARDAGVHLGFFGSDSVDGRIRFGTRDHRVFSRTISDSDSRKLEYDSFPIDASKPPHANPSDTLSGAHYGGWCSAVHSDCGADSAGKLRRADDFDIVELSHPIFRGVGGRTLPGTVGYEYEVPYGDPTQLPFTLHVLARATALDLGSYVLPSMVAYRAVGGARVVNIGSMHWAHALDGWVGRAALRDSGEGDDACAAGARDCFTRPASAAAQITANVLSDFGAVPATPSPELIQSAARPWP
ncbi:MAG: hypothetical protein LC659_13130, partial [Myxococcales bacterium]|nr:hypothetical protein [Myxococcales bacterium]